MSKLLGKVLIIEDEKRLRDLLARVLRRSGCEVYTAETGPAALIQLESTPVDLVYLDIHLPGLDGLQVLTHIRQTDTLLPVILFTGFASLKSALDAIRLGATDYLVKPIDPEVLVARTRVILDEQRIERRRREIQDQIAHLQAELQTLDQTPALPATNFEGPELGDRFIKKGHFVVDLQAQRVTLGERVLALPPTAFAYLVSLVRHAPDAVNYQSLAAEAQNYDLAQTEASDLAKYHIHVLRQAVGVKPEQPGYILNVRGIGYRILTD